MLQCGEVPAAPKSHSHSVLRRSSQLQEKYASHSLAGRFLVELLSGTDPVSTLEVFLQFSFTPAATAACAILLGLG